MHPTHPLRAYVLFGQSDYLGDYAELVHALGGYIKTIVVNIQETPVPTRKLFNERIAEIDLYFGGRFEWPRLTILGVDNFRPVADEVYMAGFRSEPVVSFCREISERFSINFPPLVHPSAVISASARLEQGCLIGPLCVVGSFVSIDAFTLLNRGATIGHDCRLGKAVRIGPNAALASNVTVEDFAAIGIGATVIEDRVVGARAMVAAGAVAVRDVAPGSTVAGVPARPIRQKFEPGIS